MIMLRKDTQAEIRILLAPLSVVMIAYAVSLGIRQWLWREANDLVFFVGVPFLAAYSFGYEFQNKTISLLLSQPVDRMAFWWQKSRLSGIAVLIASVPYLLYVIENSYGRFAPARWYNVLHNGSNVIFYVLMITCSAAFWTFVTRSIVGATALNLIGVVLVTMGIELLGWNTNFVAAFCIQLAYAVLTIWLGRRIFAVFEVTGDAQGTDFLTASGWMPSGMTSWLHCRPNQLYLNLIRKDLGMLKPVWAVAGLFVLGWLALGVWFLNVSDEIRAHGLPLGLYSMLYAAFMIATTLTAGAISLGEERNSGIHSWHLTLPISAGLHWLIKLVMALAVSAICLLLIPTSIFAGKHFLGSEYPRLFDPLSVDSLGMPFAICVFGFWCSSMVRGMMRAVLFFIPSAGAILAVAAAGNWFSRQGAVLIQSSLQHRIARFQLNPFTYSFDVPYEVYRISLFLLPIVLLCVGSMQSFRWFHRQIPDSMSWAAKRLMPLCISALLALLPSSVLGGFSGWPGVYLVSDVVRALQFPLRAALAYPEAPSSVQVALGEPDQSLDTYHISPGEDTRAWLNGATLSLSRDWSDNDPGKPPSSTALLPYTLRIHLLHGTNCTFKLIYDRHNLRFAPVQSRSDWRNQCALTPP